MADDPDEAPVVQSRRRRALRWLLIAAIACAALTLVIAILVGARTFAWSDLPAFIDRMTLWRDSPVAMLAMLGCFVAGGLVVFPVNLLIAASIVVFGPLAGAVIALAGSLASAGALHQIGTAFPEHVFTRFAGRHAEQLRERVARHGLIAVAIVRLLPVAPYSVVSLAAGIAGIGRVPYFAGTALGMLPGIVLYTLFADRARKVIADPRPLSWAMLLFALLLIVAAGLLLRHLRGRARAREAGA
jgi:phospholipase D1/2